MSECFREFFIKGSEILKCENFSDDYVVNGTSLYEVIRIIDSVPIFLERHLERLKNSASIVNLELWLSIEEIRSRLLSLIKVNNIKEGNIKIVFNYNNEGINKRETFLAYFVMHHYPSEEQYKTGVPTILCFKERNNPNAKIINTSLRSFADEKMKESGAYEAILVDRNGNITEGSRSNIFMVKKNTVITAPLKDVLPGITREVIAEICREEGMEFLEERINHNEISDLDGLFITGTSPKVLPINKVNDVVFDSSTNIIVQNIMWHYNRIIDNYIRDNRNV